MRALALAIALAAAATAPTVARADQPTAAPERKLVHTDQAMGTVVQVTIWTDDEPGAARAAQAVFAEFRRLDAMMTTWTPDSEISKINAAAGSGKAVPVSDEAYAVIARALEVSKASQGVFDITVGAYGGLVYLSTVLGGWVADRVLGMERTVLYGGVVVIVATALVIDSALRLASRRSLRWRKSEQ